MFGDGSPNLAIGCKHMQFERQIVAFLHQLCSQFPGLFLGGESIHAIESRLQLLFLQIDGCRIGLGYIGHGFGPIGSLHRISALFFMLLQGVPIYRLDKRITKIGVFPVTAVAVHVEVVARLNT